MLKQRETDLILSLTGRVAESWAIYIRQTLLKPISFSLAFLVIFAPCQTKTAESSIRLSGYLSVLVTEVGRKTVIILFSL